MNQQEKKGLKINLIIDKSSFYPLHVHFHQNLYIDIDIDKKQEVKTFFDAFISLYLSKYFSKYSNDSFEYEPESIRLMFRDKVNLNNKQRGRLFNRLHGMVKQAEAYFKYLDYRGINFNQKGAEYYLRLRLLGKYINKDKLLKSSVISLDINYLKNYHDFVIKRKKTMGNVDNLDKKLIKFKETMKEIYLDAVAYLKCDKKENIDLQKEQSNNANVKIFKPSEITKLIIDVDVNYDGEHDSKYGSLDISSYRFPSFVLYINKNNISEMDYIKIVNKLKSQLIEIVSKNFNNLLGDYLGTVSKLYNFKDNTACDVYVHWLDKRRDKAYSTEAKFTIMARYKYTRNPDILVREDDEIKSKLNGFIKYIMDRELINLDELEFNL